MRLLRILAFIALYFMLEVAVCSAQAWNTLLDQTRAVDWSHAGFTIPNYTVNCSTQPTLLTGSGNAAANTTAIQNALNSCDATHNVVNLPAGTYYVNGVQFGSQGFQVLRGAGGDQTFLINTSTYPGCGGWGHALCMQAPNWTYNSAPNVQPGQSNACTWSGGYAQGTTSIMLTSCGTPPIAGETIILDQANDTSDTGGVYLCDGSTSNCTYEGTRNANGRVIGGNLYSEEQVVYITSVSGSGTYTVGITPGIENTNVRSGQTPGAWFPGFIQNVGVENLSIDVSAIPGGAVNMLSCYRCWVKGIRVLNAERSAILMLQGLQDVVRDSYFYGAQSHTATSYNIEVDNSSDGLIENNIMQQTTQPINYNGSTSGFVADYNYVVNATFANSTWTWGPFASHATANNLHLWEGNIFDLIEQDNASGPADQNTFFRNLVTGYKPNAPNNAESIINRALVRNQNYIGNVLGYPGFHTAYQGFPTSTTTFTTSGAGPLVYDIGGGGTGDACSLNPPQSTLCDPLSYTSLMRWGNYDTVNAATQWNSSEASPAANTYVNANFTSSYFASLAHTLPASLIYNSAPSWWGSENWPPIGPDVTTGNIGLCSGGTYAQWMATGTKCTWGSLSTAWASHASSNPAMDCYLNTMSGPPDGSGSALAFNAATCYSGGGTNYSLTVSTAGTGSGTVSGTNCTTGSYASGTTIGACTANPASGSTFTGWTSSGSASCPGLGTCGPFSLISATAITANFSVTAATPTFSLSGNRVSIATTTPSATIYYTVDGSTPTPASQVYSHPLLTLRNVTYKAIAAAVGFSNSAVGSQSYAPTAQKTVFSLTPTSSSSSPVPYPPDLRACCGSNVAALEATRGTYTLTVLHNWITAATSNGSTFTYTIQGFPAWMTGLSATESAPPSDLHTFAACQNVLTGTTTTDCSMKEFITNLMMDRTGLSSQPSTPVTCANLDYLEIINEFNTDSPSGSSTGWTGTYADLATLGNDISTITHAWCSNTVVIGGSASAIVGFHSNGADGHYDVALETLLQDWAGIINPSLPDAISVHLYPSRNNIVEMPMPTTIVSHSDATCTSGNTSNSSCYIAVKDEVNQLNTTATLQNSSIVSWAKTLPIYSTEGGFGEVSQLGGTSTTTIGASYVAESMMAIAAQNPVNHMFYAADDPTWGCYWNCGSVTGVTSSGGSGMTAGTYPLSFSGGGGSGAAGTITVTTSTVTNITISSAGVGYGSTPTVTAATGGTPPTLTATIGTSAWLFAYNQMLSWLGAHTITGTLTSTAITGGNKWSLQLDSGAAELDFCDAWLASCTTSTSFNTQTTLANVTSPTGGSLTLTQEPVLLTNSGVVATPTFSPVAGTYASTQTVTISTTTSGATICYTTDGSTPTANGAGTCTHGTTYSGPVLVSSSLTLKAVGSKNLFTDSSVSSAAYVINLVAAPVNLSGKITISGGTTIQ